MNIYDRFDERPVKIYVGDGEEWRIYTALDATVCPIQRPGRSWADQKAFFDPKKGLGLKYEIAIGVRDGRIIWIAGPGPASIHDKLFTDTYGFALEMAKGAEHRNFLEGVFCDKGYVGLPPWAFHPIKGHPNYLTPAEAQYNKTLSSHRVMVERVFARIKSFAILSEPFRGDHDLHGVYFRVICYLVNLSAEIDSPFTR